MINLGPKDDRHCAQRSAIRKLATDKDGTDLYWNGRTKKYFEFTMLDAPNHIDAARLLSKWGITDGEDK
jgi:hypothetical protein